MEYYQDLTGDTVCQTIVLKNDGGEILEITVYKLSVKNLRDTTLRTLSNEKIQIYTVSLNLSSFDQLVVTRYNKSGEDDYPLPLINLYCSILLIESKNSADSDRFLG